MCVNPYRHLKTQVLKQVHSTLRQMSRVRNKGQYGFLGEDLNHTNKLRPSPVVQFVGTVDIRHTKQGVQSVLPLDRLAEFAQD